MQAVADDWTSYNVRASRLFHQNIQGEELLHFRYKNPLNFVDTSELETF